MTTVSVLLATRNGARHLEAQLESILRQTMTPRELYVADNGSTDETLRIVSSFAVRAHFPVRIRVNTEPEGQSDNVLGAAMMCEGDFIALADQGDEWHPEKLERCAEALVREDALLCAHSATLIDEGSHYLGYLGQGIDRNAVHEALTLPPWSAFLDITQVFRRELLSWVDFRRRGPDDLAGNTVLRHDRWIYFLAHGLGRVVTLSHPLARRRQRAAPGSMLWRQFGGRPGSLQDLLERRCAAALYRSNLLTQFALERPRRPIAVQARIAAVYWRSQSDIYTLRKTIHQATSFSERNAALSRLLAMGTYGRGDAGMLGSAELAKDLVGGVLQLPFSRGGRRAPDPAASRQRPGATPADS
jgi:glycosyltransferase involved in cell wall biosynthesis